MPNKSSPHGGTISAGFVVSSGTLRTVDLLASFADEYERVLPFNSRELVADARTCRAEILENENHPGNHQTGMEIVEELTTALNECAAREGLTFGTEDGDGACFGYWSTEDDE